MLVFQSPGDVWQEVCSFSGNLSHDMTLRHSIQRTRDTVNGPLTLKTQLSSDPCLSPRKQLTLWVRVTGLRQVLPLTWTLEASQSDLWKRPLSRRAVGKPPIVMAAFIKPHSVVRGCLVSDQLGIRPLRCCQRLHPQRLCRSLMASHWLEESPWGWCLWAAGNGRCLLPFRKSRYRRNLCCHPNVVRYPDTVGNVQPVWVHHHTAVAQPIDTNQNILRSIS